MIQSNEIRKPSRQKAFAIWIFVIIVGFIFFVIPQIPFQMGYFGGYGRSNLSIIGLLQFLLVIPLIYWGLRKLSLDFKSIGLILKKCRPDALLGAGVAICWAVVQFVWIIPSTGGANRADIVEILSMLDHQWINILWYLPLGMIGGGLTEELYNRGFFIGGIIAIFGSSKIIVGIASMFAILFFAAGHIPTNIVDWVDLLIPSTAYTILFLYTKRITASIVAHSLWNILAVIFIYVIYAA